MTTYPAPVCLQQELQALFDTAAPYYLRKSGPCYRIVTATGRRIKASELSHTSDFCYI